MRKEPKYIITTVMLPPLLATIFSDLGGCTMHCSCKTSFTA